MEYQFSINLLLSVHLLRKPFHMRRVVVSSSLIDLSLTVEMHDPHELIVVVIS